ncbi:MAG: hypothetical protein LBI82_12085 [Dysgonamonadaceae bacterium]|jgi:uncharacterized membrane protein HdeD (DUF308 family)|nr:hypothetical protein [Dysgonamonadaceae bacterium]
MKNTGFLYIFGSVMALLYLVISYMLLFTSIFDNSITDKTIRLFLGILLGFYGIFRVVMAILKYQEKKREDR